MKIFYMKGMLFPFNNLSKGEERGLKPGGKALSSRESN